MIELLEVAITLAGDNKSKDVREAADPAVDVILTKLSPLCHQSCQKAIFAGFAESVLAIQDGCIESHRLFCRSCAKIRRSGFTGIGPRDCASHG